MTRKTTQLQLPWLGNMPNKAGLNRQRSDANGGLLSSQQSLYSNDDPILVQYLTTQKNLELSSAPAILPCRDNECTTVLIYLQELLEAESSGCLYISGVPGTGKTATVMRAIDLLCESRSENEINDFEFVSINGMKLTDPHQFYVKLWQSISHNNSKVTTMRAVQLLDEYFSQPVLARGRPKKGMTVLLVDELDVLVTKSQTVLYNLFEWSTRATSQLIVISIANTMNLPERMLHHKISSRLGLKRLNFMPYTHDQLAHIVLSRIDNSPVFDRDAVQLCARKISAVSGDARRALEICRRAVEIAEAEYKQSIKTNPTLNPNPNPNPNPSISPIPNTIPNPNPNPNTNFNLNLIPNHNPNSNHTFTSSSIATNLDNSDAKEKNESSDTTATS
ncbi:Origin recognition complex subunit 1, partial [Zancudomyces culisetae]